MLFHYRKGYNASKNAEESQKFYTDGIIKLPEKWQKVKDNKGTYVLI